MHIAVFASISIVLYLVAAALLAQPFLRAQSPRQNNLGLILAAVAIALHLLVLVIAHRHGLDLHFFAALSIVGAGVAALCLVVNFNRDVAPLGVIAFPLAALLLAVDVFLAPPTQALPLSPQIRLHVTVALLGYSVLSVAALLAVLLAAQERALRARQFDGVLRVLPPLTATESLMFRLIGVGFLLLTMTLITGASVVTGEFNQHLLLATAAWIVFGALLLGRWRYGWRGAQAIWLTLGGMALLLLAFFGSRFVFEVLLNRPG